MQVSVTAAVAIGILLSRNPSVGQPLSLRSVTNCEWPQDNTTVLLPSDLTITFYPSLSPLPT